MKKKIGFLLLLASLAFGGCVNEKTKIVKSATTEVVKSDAILTEAESLPNVSDEEYKTALANVDNATKDVFSALKKKKIRKVKSRRSADSTTPSSVTTQEAVLPEGVEKDADGNLTIKNPNVELSKDVEDNFDITTDKNGYKVLKPKKIINISSEDGNYSAEEALSLITSESYILKDTKKLDEFLTAIDFKDEYIAITNKYNVKESQRKIHRSFNS